MLADYTSASIHLIQMVLGRPSGFLQSLGCLRRDRVSMVAISAHLHIDHSLFHGREPPSVTEASLSQDRACGTVCRLL